MRARLPAELVSLEQICEAAHITHGRPPAVIVKDGSDAAAAAARAMRRDRWVGEWMDALLAGPDLFGR